MGTIVVGSSHVPAFLAKLWRIVDDPATNELICWSEAGNSFIIKNQAKFSRELLPLYYKHNNMASFVRQLNMYGFHKVLSVEQGGLRLDRDEMEFAHPFFIQGSEGAIEYIKRKISNSKIEELKGKPDTFNKVSIAFEVLMDVRQMKGRQEAMDSKLSLVKRENEALWRELSALRQKHVKQQQIVSKLLQFLVSMMSSPQSHRLAFKRRMPLMINDVDSKRAKESSSSEKTLEDESSNGPVIHEVFETDDQMNSLNQALELTQAASNGAAAKKKKKKGNARMFKIEDILNKAVAETIGSSLESTIEGNPEIITSPEVVTLAELEAENNEQSCLSPGPEVNIAESTGVSPVPEKCIEELGNDPTLAAAVDIDTQPKDSISQSTSARAPSPQVIPSNAVVKPKQIEVIIPDDLDGHLDEVQYGLDSLKNLLQGSSYNIDSSTLTGVGSDILNFNHRDTLSQLFGHENDLPLFGLMNEGVNETNKQGEEEGSSTDVVAYNPCLFELAEDDAHFFESEPDNIFLDDELDMMLTTDRNKLNCGPLKS